MVIAFLIPDAAHSFGFSVASDVFDEANRQVGSRVYDVKFVSEHPGLTTCLSGLRILADHTIDEPLGPIDTLIVAGNRHPAGSASPAMIDWLKRMRDTTRRF